MPLIVCRQHNDGCCGGVPQLMRILVTFKNQISTEKSSLSFSKLKTAQKIFNGNPQMPLGLIMDFSQCAIR